MPSHRSTERFSSRVADYVKYRPRYPREVLDILRDRCGLTPDWTVADLGSGTGFLTELFLSSGNRTYAVEPNQAMREAGEALLRSDPNFTSVSSTAEETTLPDASVELITAGQAFHWFDRPRAKAEFRRILRPGGWVVLVWNERILEGSPFMQAYETLVTGLDSDYAEINHKRMDDAVLREFFAPSEYQYAACPNPQAVDLEGLLGRFSSSSYAPEPGQPQYESAVAELKRIFAAHQESGRVVFVYETRMYFGRL